MIHPVVLLAPEVGEAAHQGPEVEVLGHLAEPVVAHQGQQKAVHPEVAVVVHPAVAVVVHPAVVVVVHPVVVAALQALEEEVHLVPVHPVAEAALQVVQSKAVHPVEGAVHLVAVQSTVVRQAVRRKVALQERVHRDDC